MSCPGVSITQETARSGDRSSAIDKSGFMGRFNANSVELASVYCTVPRDTSASSSSVSDSLR